MRFRETLINIRSSFLPVSVPLGVRCAKSTFRGMKCQTKVFDQKNKISAQISSLQYRMFKYDGLPDHQFAVSDDHEILKARISRGASPEALWAAAGDGLEHVEHDRGGTFYYHSA